MENGTDLSSTQVILQTAAFTKILWLISGISLKSATLF